MPFFDLIFKWLLQVADTQKLADFVANSASVEYSIENLEPPIL